MKQREMTGGGGWGSTVLHVEIQMPKKPEGEHGAPPTGLRCPRGSGSYLLCKESMDVEGSWGVEAEAKDELIANTVPERAGKVTETRSTEGRVRTTAGKKIRAHPALRSPPTRTLQTAFPARQGHPSSGSSSPHPHNSSSDTRGAGAPLPSCWFKSRL